MLLLNGLGKLRLKQLAWVCLGAKFNRNPTLLKGVHETRKRFYSAR